MTSYRKGEVVWVAFPFTNRAAVKRRPAVILSTLAYNQRVPDVIIAPITSNPNTMPHLGDHRLMGWQSAGLLRPSIVKAKPETIDAALIQGSAGMPDPADLAAVEAGLRLALDLP